MDKTIRYETGKIINSLKQKGINKKTGADKMPLFSHVSDQYQLEEISKLLKPSEQLQSSGYPDA